MNLNYSKLFKDIASNLEPVSELELVLGAVLPEQVAGHQVKEGFPEVPVEDAVDDGVEHGVGVAEPEGKG